MALLWGVVILSVPFRTRAEDNLAQQCVARLDDAQVTRLLAFTERSLREQRLGGGLWFGGWSAFNAANVAAGAWGIATTQGAERSTWIMSTVGAAAFLVGVSVQPLPALYAHRRMLRLQGKADTRARLRRGLELLESAALGEETNSNLTAHLLGLGFAGLSAGYIWLRHFHDDRKGGAIGAAIQGSTTAVAVEAIIWTTPRRARSDFAYAIEHFCLEPEVAPARHTRVPARQRLSLSGVGLRFAF